MLKQMILHRTYNVLTYLALPAILGRLALKGLRCPEYYQRLGERLGISKNRSTGNLIWIHAVSVGEVQSGLDNTCLQNLDSQAKTSYRL